MPQVSSLIPQACLLLRVKRPGASQYFLLSRLRGTLASAALLLRVKRPGASQYFLRSSYTRIRSNALFLKRWFIHLSSQRWIVVCPTALAVHIRTNQLCRRIHLRI